LEERLRLLPETRARAYSANAFGHRVRVAREHLLAPEEWETVFREACLRAALAEFVSLDAAAARDFKRLGLGVSPPRISLSPNPLLHIFLLLRHLNIHLLKSELSIAKKPAYWTIDGEEHHFEYSVWSVTGVTLEAVSALRDARHYSPKDLSSLVNWFNDQQQEWGALHMLLLATRAHCEAVVELAEAARASN
jgi:hypothetical protein